MQNKNIIIDDRFFNKIINLFTISFYNHINNTKINDT